MAIDITKVLQKIESFPTLPTIYEALVKTTSNPTATIQDITNVIMQDQATVTRILKIINSPLYGMTTKVTSISKSIMLLGINEIKNIILSLSIVDFFAPSDENSTQNKNTNKYMVEIWKHSIAVGVINHQLGVILKIRDLENCFIAGLTHDIGKLFFITSFPSLYSEVIDEVKTRQIDLYTAERNAFGFDHDTVGDFLAKKWKLPLTIQNAVKYHHRYNVNNSDKLSACVHLANTMAKCMSLGDSFENEIIQPNEEIWNVLNWPINIPIYSLRNVIVNSYRQSLSMLGNRTIET